MPLSTRREFFAALGAAPLTQVAATASLARNEFLFDKGLVYLNTAALGPCTRRVLDATQRAWRELERNPAAMAYGQGATLAAAEAVRSAAAGLLGCDSEDIVITRSTTDGMNAVAQGLEFTAGDRVLTTDQEHEGGTCCWTYSAKRFGVEIDTVQIPVREHDPARVLELIAERMNSRTRVISVSHVLSSTGMRMPIAEISALAHSRGAFCVVDGAQTVGGIDVNVKSLGCDAYATSGHKWLMGPKGTGLLYLTKNAREQIKPIQLEDGRAYYSHSVGVGNLPGAIGLGVAIKLLQSKGTGAVERHNLGLRNRLYVELQRLPKVQVVSAAPGAGESQLITFALPLELDSQALTATLRQRHKIIVKMVPKRWLNGIRLSPHIFNTTKEVDRLNAALKTELAAAGVRA